MCIVLHPILRALYGLFTGGAPSSSSAVRVTVSRRPFTPHTHHHRRRHPPLSPPARSRHETACPFVVTMYLSGVHRVLRNVPLAAPPVFWRRPTWNSAVPGQRFRVKNPPGGVGIRIEFCKRTAKRSEYGRYIMLIFMTTYCIFLIIIMT